MTFEGLEDYAAFVTAKGIKDHRISVLRRLQDAYGKPLLDLSAREINDWLASLTGRDGKGIATKTSQAYVAYVKNALKYLNGGEQPPVCKKIAAKRGKALIPRIKSPSELLTPAEFRRLVEASSRLDLKALLSISRATGARPGEVLSLEHADLDFKADNGTSYLEVHFRKTKTESPRTVFTPNQATIRYCQEWMKANPNPPLWRFHGEKTYWRHLKALAKKAGISKNVYPYLFRHMRASELHDAPSGVRDNQMGWTPGSKMSANYEHLQTRQFRDAILKREGGHQDEAIPTAAEERLDALIDVLVGSQVLTSGQARDLRQKVGL